MQIFVNSVERLNSSVYSAPPCSFCRQWEWGNGNGDAREKGNGNIGNVWEWQ